MGPWAKRVLVWGVVVAAIGAGLAYAFRPQPVPVDVVTLERGPMRVTVDEDAITRVKDVYVVSAPVAGRLLRIDLEVGDPVVAGETVVARLQESEPSFLDRRAYLEAQAEVKAAEAAVGLAEAELARARAELAFAEAEYERYAALRARGTVSQQAFDRAKLDLERRRADVARAEAELAVRRSELEVARARLVVPGPKGALGRAAEACCVEVRAPASGRVLRLLQESETVVAAGTPLVEIGDPRDLEVVVDLLSSDAVRVRPGNPVIIDDWGGPAPLEGVVSRIEPFGYTKVSALGIEEQRVDVIVDFVDPPEARASLAHGFQVMARIVVWQADDVLRLPLGALLRADDGWAVYVVEDGVARLRGVAIGHSNGEVAEVREGLGAGERVIEHPSDRVADGVAVVLRGR